VTKKEKELQDKISSETLRSSDLQQKLDQVKA
jgi:hypothetical protein